jgi:hypothetical protein
MKIQNRLQQLWSNTRTRRQQLWGAGHAAEIGNWEKPTAKLHLHTHTHTHTRFCSYLFKKFTTRNFPRHPWRVGTHSTNGGWVPPVPMERGYPQYQWRVGTPSTNGGWVPPVPMEGGHPQYQWSVGTRSTNGAWAPPVRIEGGYPQYQWRVGTPSTNGAWEPPVPMEGGYPSTNGAWEPPVPMEGGEPPVPMEGGYPPVPMESTACTDTVKKKQIPTAVRNTTLIPTRAALILFPYSLNNVVHQMNAEGKAQNVTADANSTVAHCSSM